MKKGVRKLLGLSLLGLTTNQLLAQDRIIYGEDNRLDLYSVQNPDHLKWARSTALITRNSNLTARDAVSKTLATSPYKNNVHAVYPLCAEEPFADQVVGGTCSGFLVGPDVFVTAGHCINTSDCSTKSIVFDFSISEAGGIGPNIIPNENIYKCSAVLGHQLNGTTLSDFAVIKLDRPVVGREPLQIRRSGKIADGEDLVLIGHPTGLPTKVAAGASVGDNANSVYFSANTDSYAGNSGSAVFNANTGVVEGILVRGAADFVKAPGRSCVLDNVVAATPGGEDVTRPSEFARFVPDISNPPVVPGELVDLQMLSPIAVPDNSAAGITHSFDVAQAKTVASGSLVVDITHPYVGDLKLSLIAPNGQVIVLHNRDGGSGDDIKKSFDLAALAGVSAQGIWKVQVADLAARDVGKVNSLKLQLALNP